MNDKVKFSPEQLVSSTQLARGLSQQLDKATKMPLFIQRDQKVEWVLMSLNDYRNLLNMLTTNFELQTELQKNSEEERRKWAEKEKKLKIKYGLE